MSIRNDLLEQIQKGKPWLQQISEGRVSGYSTVDKFGENSDVDTGSSPEDIWEGQGLYIYDATGTAPIQYVSSSDNGDVQELSIAGLDIDGEEVVQSVTLTGQANATLTTHLWRVYRMENIDNTDVAGIVYCHTDPSPSAGVPSVASQRAIINNGNNQSLMAIYTIPKGKVGFLYRGELSISRSQSTGAAQCAYYSRRFGKVFKVKKRIDITNQGSSVYQDSRSFPDIIPALTDIRLNVESVSANNTGVTGTFDILLADEGTFSDSYLAAIGQPGY